MDSKDKSVEYLPDIIIADTQFLITEGLKAILEKKGIINSVVCSKSELLKAMQNGSPRILIVDYFLMDFDGFDELREIARRYPAMGIIILSNNVSCNELIEFKNIGINTILDKNLEEVELFACIDAILAGRKYYSSYIADMIIELNGRRGTVHETTQLTRKEIEIVQLIAKGLTTKEIASSKFISFHTVMTHRKNILRKLHVSNASELIMYAIKSGIIDTIEYHI